MTVPMVSDNMYSSIILQVSVFFLLMLFIGGFSFLVSRMAEKIVGRKKRICILLALIIISFVAFLYSEINLGLFGFIVEILAISWFPAAIILAGAIFWNNDKDPLFTFRIFAVSSFVFVTELLFDKYSGIIGLRSLHFFIIYPPPALPYEFLNIPEIDKLIIQCCITFLLASLIFWLWKKVERSHLSTG